jgi:hypothetical protein
VVFKKEIGLIAAGFLLGTVGVKAATSAPAKQLCVQAVSKGLQVKAAGQDIIEQAKSNFDDIVAEANYLNNQDEEAEQNITQDTTPDPVQSTKKSSRKK